MDPTALQRQNRRLTKLRDQGIGRTTVFVHDDCKAALEEFRPYLMDARSSDVLESLVAQLKAETTRAATGRGPRYSVLRYPGGKSWLIPEIKAWISSLTRSPATFVEPFAGGGIAGLSVAAEGLAKKVVLSEIDEDVAAVWQVIFGDRSEDVEWLCERIKTFLVTEHSVRNVLGRRPRNLRERAFRTIVRNRTGRGGVMASGAGLLRRGEDDKGLSSRWYSDTLIDRIGVLREIRNRVVFERADALDVIKKYYEDVGATFFIDPPYSAGGKNAGRRLYRHNHIDHDALFALVASAAGPAMLTYHDVPEVRAMARKHEFCVREITMKTAHHVLTKELLILKP